MDMFNKFTGSQGEQQQQQQQQQPQQQTQQSGSTGSGSGGFMDKLHGMAGGGPESEKKEDHLDKGDFSTLPIRSRLPPFSGEQDDVIDGN